MDAVNGRNRPPNTAQFNTMPDNTIKVPRHPYSRIKKSMSGAKMNVPSPEPATPIPFHRKSFSFVKLSVLKIEIVNSVKQMKFGSPVARDRSFSK